ncbi:hypothetical protein BDBG_16400 [Blastomyces gilchristii SLH14081]|uniref:Uncharacterized protein n=1 Tax=Blastomyces gilchristii (strain SLH14081) TaxID=559298 RepID=A0A179UBF7_BLAGS|nr:uncharacterized protein BDBG_16400 [Blastomyces gilchristii SLH14081]OAT05053.1 hypothetical protein BDBG_16400 [Blastomyces gilchristii SLH14081]
MAAVQQIMTTPDEKSVNRMNAHWELLHDLLPSSILDWAHTGWYPEYWEYCKALYTPDYKEEWRNVGIPNFLTA